MIIQCPDCTTRYELDASRVPAGRIRVRCARCHYVFPIEAEAPAAVSMADDPGVTQDAWSSGVQSNASGANSLPLLVIIAGELTIRTGAGSASWLRVTSMKTGSPLSTE